MTATGNIVPSTMRARKSKILASKRSRARENGVTLTEGALIASKDGSFSAYIWNGEEFVEIGYGRLLPQPD